MVAAVKSAFLRAARVKSAALLWSVEAGASGQGVLSGLILPFAVP